MNKLFKILTFIVLTCITVSVNGQDFEQSIIDQVTAFIENQDADADFDFNRIYEQYQLLIENPINLNKASKDQLLSIPLISEFQIISLLDHIKKVGSLNNYYELQTIPGFDRSTISLLENTTFLRNALLSSSAQEIAQERDWNHILFLKWKRGIETQEGYTREDSTGYLGSPDHLYLLYKLNIGKKYQLGFLAEKDNGEPFYYPDKIAGADYYSFHASAKNLNKTIKFIGLGDYNVSLGQGLILHSGFGAGKSALTTDIRKGGYALRPYTSVAEYNFLRGAATTLNVSKNLETTLFISHKNREGNLREAETDDPFTGPFTSSLSEAGFHRTISEIEKKNTLQQTTLGGQVKLKNIYGHIAFNGLYDKLSVPLVNNNQLYQYFNFNSDRIWNTSLDYGYVYKNLNIFGEVAYASTGGVSQVHGLLLSLNRYLSTSISYRNYAPNYMALNANSFGESINASNEQGIYLGLSLKPHKQWIISAYADQWNNPWLKFRVDGISDGSEYFLRVYYFKKRTWEIYGQYFYETKYRNFESKITQLKPTVKQRFRVHGAYKITKEWELRNRVEWSLFNDENQEQNVGFIIYQDILYKPTGKDFSFTTRYAFFDVPDYDARIYAYENDIINEYYIPAYNGQGFRFYFNARYRVNRWLRIEGRYEITKYQEINGEPIGFKGNSIGSGRNEILGDTRSLFKFQLRYTW